MYLKSISQKKKILNLILYKFCKNYSSYSIYENYKSRFINIKLNDFKVEVKKIRTENDTDEICEIIKGLINKTNYKGDCENFILATKNIFNEVN